MISARNGDVIAQYSGTNQSLGRLMGGSLRDLDVRVRKLGHQFPGFSGPVTGLALNADESLIYASTRSGTVIAVSRETWECVKVFTGHQWWVSDVAFKKNIIASAGADKTVRLWDTDGNCLQVLKAHKDVVTGVAFSPEGKRLASSGRDGLVHVWRKNRACRWLVEKTFAGHKGWVLGLCFADEKRVVSAGVGDAFLWNVGNGEVLARLFHAVSDDPPFRLLQSPLDYISGDLSALKAHCLGSQAVIVQSDGAMLWDLATGSFLKNIGGKAAICAAQLGFEGQAIALSGLTDSIYVLDLSKQRAPAVLRGHTDWTLALVFTREGHVISGSLDSSVREWDLKGPTSIAMYTGQTRSICDIDLRGETLAVGGHDNAVSVYDLAMGERRSVYADLHHWVNVAVLSPDASKVAAGTIDGEAVIVSSKNGKLLHTALFRGGPEVTHMAFSSDGALLLVGMKNGNVFLFDVETGVRLREYPLCSGLVHHIQFLRGDTEYLAACWDGNTYRVSLALGSILSIYPQAGVKYGGDYVEMASLSSDRKKLLTVAFDGMVRIYDFNSGEMKGFFRAHTGRTRSMAIRGDDLLATGGLDACIRLWDWKHQRLIHTLRDCGDSITALQFSAKGDRLIAGSRDGTVRFFSCNGSYKLLATLYSLHGRDWLWETPDGWFYTNRPDLLEVFECDENGENSSMLSKDDPRVHSYLVAQNSYIHVKAAVLGGIFEERACQFDKLVAGHRAKNQPLRLLSVVNHPVNETTSLDNRRSVS